MGQGAHNLRGKEQESLGMTSLALPLTLARWPAHSKSWGETEVWTQQGQGRDGRVGQLRRAKVRVEVGGEVQGGAR